MGEDSVFHPSPRLRVTPNSRVELLEGYYRTDSTNKRPVTAYATAAPVGEMEIPAP